MNFGVCVLLRYNYILRALDARFIQRICSSHPTADFDISPRGSIQPEHSSSATSTGYELRANGIDTLHNISVSSGL